MSPSSKPTHIHKLITGPKSQLHGLLKQAEQLQISEAIIKQALEPELQKRCRLINLHRDSLTLATANAAWATKIRYAIPEMLSSLKSITEIADIKTIRVVIMPESAEKDKRPPKKLSLNNNTAKIIQDMADTVTDQELSACLKRISAHTVPKI